MTHSLFRHRRSPWVGAGYIYLAGDDRTGQLPALNSFRNRAVIASTDGVTWQPIGDLPSGFPSSLAAEPFSAGTLLIGGMDGIWKITDNGAHWRHVLSTDRDGAVAHSLAAL